MTDDIFHNGPDPSPTNPMLYVRCVGITSAPAVWPDVLAALRSSSTTLLVTHSDAAGASSRGAPQHTRMLAELTQPASDAFDASDLARMNAAAAAVGARASAGL